MPEMNNNNQSSARTGGPMRRGPMGGGPMGGMGGGKARNMRESLMNLLSYCRSQAGIILFALVLAALGAVFTIIGPNQISRLTDYIYDGLSGGVSSEEMAEDIQNQVSSGEINLLDYLPEDVNIEDIDLSVLDLTDTDNELTQAILSNIKLSEEYQNAHADDGIDMDGILGVALLLVGIYFASALCNFIQHYIMQTVTQRTAKRLRGDIDTKINRLPLKYFSGNAAGDVLSRMTNDVDMIGQAMSNSLSNLVTAVAQFIGCLIMMYYTNWVMATTTVVATVIGLVLMVVIMSRSQKYFTARQKSLGRLNGYIEEMYSGHDVIRILDAEDEVKGKFSSMNRAVKNAEFRSQFLSGMMQPLMTFIGNLGYVATCVAGAALIIDGQITFGVITAFLIYTRLFETPLRQISMAMTQVQSCAAASERVFEFLSEEEMEDESAKMERIDSVRGEVEFRNVKFSYPSVPDKEIIHNFSVKVMPGQKVAIVGPTGAGKTTMVNLLMRFFEPTGGTIYIDGVPTESIPRSNVHSQFGMVLQDTWLFEGTVRENLLYNTEGVSDEQMAEACRACGIHDFIQAMPKGYDSVLSDNTAISAGQKQLMTIARAMIQNSPMLILDEATSSVDTKTEMLTQQAMDKLTDKRTSFVIAHRLSTIKNADIILVMRDGDIVEQGSHEELLKQNGFYAELYNSQFEQAS
ncbi:MAG: ATP-binding cassette domain-containing protein [Clostridiaceae bacterium]|nr:ATP-binding cassette domain-containing protein [Clostridiaceae bacterium]